MFATAPERRVIEIPSRRSLSITPPATRKLVAPQTVPSKLHRTQKPQTEQARSLRNSVEGRRLGRLQPTRIAVPVAVVGLAQVVGRGGQSRSPVGLAPYVEEVGARAYGAFCAGSRLTVS